MWTTSIPKQLKNGEKDYFSQSGAVRERVKVRLRKNDSSTKIIHLDKE